MVLVARQRLGRAERDARRIRPGAPDVSARDARAHLRAAAPADRVRLHGGLAAGDVADSPGAIRHARPVLRTGQTGWCLGTGASTHWAGSTRRSPTRSGTLGPLDHD